jgi:hypothetical protein
MSITKATASFSTEHYEVFAIRCVRGEDTEFNMPVDAYIAFDRYTYNCGEPMPEPVCTVAIRDYNQFIERSNESEYVRLSDDRVGLRPC